MAFSRSWYSVQKGSKLGEFFVPSSRLFHNTRNELIKCFQSDSFCKRNVNDKLRTPRVRILVYSREDIDKLFWCFSVNYYIECDYFVLFYSRFKCFQASLIKSECLRLNRGGPLWTATNWILSSLSVFKSLNSTHKSVAYSSSCLV